MSVSYVCLIIANRFCFYKLRMYVHMVAAVQRQCRVCLHSTHACSVWVGWTAYCNVICAILSALVHYALKLQPESIVLEFVQTMTHSLIH